MRKFFIKEEHYDTIEKLATKHELPKGSVTINQLIDFIVKKDIWKYVSMDYQSKWSTDSNGVYDNPSELSGWESRMFENLISSLKDYNEMIRRYMVKKNTHTSMGDYKMVVTNIINILKIDTITFKEAPHLVDFADFEVPYTYFCTEVPLDHKLTLVADNFVQERTFRAEERPSLKNIRLKGHLTLRSKVYPKFPKNFELIGFIQMDKERVTLPIYFKMLENIKIKNHPTLDTSNAIPFPDVTGNTLHIGDMVSFVPSSNSPIHMGTVIGCSPLKIRVQSSFTHDKFTVNSSQIVRII